MFEIGQIGRSLIAAPILSLSLLVSGTNEPEPTAVQITANDNTGVKLARSPVQIEEEPVFDDAPVFEPENREDLVIDWETLKGIELKEIPSMPLANRLQLMRTIEQYLKENLSKPEEAKRLEKTLPLIGNLSDYQEFGYNFALRRSLVELHKAGKISNVILLSFQGLCDLIERNSDFGQKIPLGTSTIRAEVFKLLADLIKIPIDKGILNNQDWEDFFSKLDLPGLIESIEKNLEPNDKISKFAAVVELFQKLLNNSVENGKISEEEAKDYWKSFTSGHPLISSSALARLLRTIGSN